MKLPAINRILTEDIQNPPPWINSLLDPLNQFMDITWQILNKNVTFTDNFLSFVKQVSYITPSTYPSGVSNISFQNTLKTKATGVLVAQAYDSQQYIPAPGPVYAPWIENNGSIVIYPITGLLASTTYSVTFVVF